MTSDTPWLSAQEERLWRGWLTLNAELSATLQRELQDDSGLSMPDFDVLVHLTDSPEGRVRVTELARLLYWERSRVSHHVTRMERRGLVERTECAEDGRGAFIAVTPAGRAAIEQAAPGHVRAVRRLMFDALSKEEVDRLATAIDKMLTRLA
jgi:DNA-binding MarR family transcriptional regulator